MRISDWSSDVCSSDLAVEDAVAAEAVVEFVDREHLPHAEIMQTIELCIDLVLVAAVDFRQAAGLLHAAVEQMRNLDAEDDRHLAVVDHLARLGRCLDDAEPALEIGRAHV